MAEHNEIGRIGENIAKSFLVKLGFLIHETNYRTRYGEIDIIAEKDSVLRFIEVKSVKVRDWSSIATLSVKPEDNFTQAKWNKTMVSVSTYMQHKHANQGRRYQIDLACVYINTGTREGKVKLIENVHRE